MKRSISFIAILALVVMVGCSGDSPSAKPVPTVVPTAWGMPSFSASSLSPLVGTVIQVDAQITKDGSPAPDGTSVNFLSTGPGTVFGFTGGLITKGDLLLEEDVTVLTEGGYATTFFTVVPANETENPAGNYLLQARADNVVKQLTVQYRASVTTDGLALFSIDPRRGSYSGGDQAVIVGKGIQMPIEVYFDLNGVAYQAIIAGVTESIPLSEDGSITVVTPAFTGANNSIQQTADVRVIANAGTGSQETAILSNAFVLLPGGGPQIFGVSPNSGRSSGGEIVNILGQNFGSVASDLSVSFTDPDGVVRLASVLSVAPDGTQIQVETPRFSTLPLTEDQPQDVAVSTVEGGTSLEDAFIVLADNPNPNITSISPTAGPLEGGTLVTIFGNGFQAPMQVFFGNLAAIDVNIFNDTTPANEDRITCVSPNYSQQNDVPPVVVDVKVVAINTGAQSSYSNFTYGDNFYISGNSPQEGGLGDLVIIYGSGFLDPLQVFLAGEQMQVISVSGTEIVVRIPDDLGTECGARGGAFRVLLLESNLETSGGDFTIRGNSPQVLRVTPIIISEADLGTGDADIVINGQYFSPEVLVRVGNYIAPSADVTVNSSTSIDVRDLPGIDQLGIVFNPIPCITGGGEPGVSAAATPVAVTVTNFPGDCSDTLPGAIVIEPSASECTALMMSVSPTNLAFGTDTTPQAFTIFNDGPGSIEWTATETSDSDGVFSFSPSSGLLDVGGTAIVSVTFTLAAATDPSHTGSIEVESTVNGVDIQGSPETVNLTASTP